MSSLLHHRWVQLLAGILGMVAVTNLQYGWTLFVQPLCDRFEWKQTDVQIAFTLFVLAETWLVPLEAYLADRFGPRRLVIAGAFLAGGGWVINAHATELRHIYIGNVVAGTGAGIVYGVSIGNALKWFPDRRGLAAGLTSAAFGAGSALTVMPLTATIRDYGYDQAFLWFGLAQGLVVLLTALIMRSPSARDVPPAPARVVQSRHDYSPIEMIHTPAFWLLYLMMTMVSMGGMMVTPQLAPIAKSYQVSDVTMLHFLGVTYTALALAMMLDRVLNGLTRPFFGFISDYVGRELTMFLAFTLEGFAILLLINFAHNPLLFVLLTGLTYFAWGEVYSLFPALVGDMFGRKFASANYGLMYTAKGMATLLVPVGSWLHERTGSWVPIFALAIAFDWITACLALFVLKPLRARWMATTDIELAIMHKKERP